jgi:tetratricopeptide (TPR) repeat protein
VIAALALLFVFQARTDSLLDESSRKVFSDAMRSSLIGRHEVAETAARNWDRARLPEGRILQAVVGISRFTDLHEPAALARARGNLDEALARLAKGRSVHERYLRALALSQDSYLASIEGQNLTAALSGREAAALCRELMAEGYDSPELKGILGGYLFWKSQSLGVFRSAFGGDTREKGIEWTRQAAAVESPFQEAYRTSLMWIRFERKEFAQGLALARAGLATAPGNRSYRQAEGDMLFRLGRLQEALETYRTSWTEYVGIEQIPANRLSAAGNLARIHEAAGRPDSARAWLDTLDAARYLAVRKWLPPSLVKELEPVRKRLGRR